MKKGLFGLVGLLAIALVGCRSGGDSGLVATVNSVPIKTSDYDRFLQLMPQVTVQTNSGPQLAQPVGSLGFQALERMISQEVLLQVAKEDGVYPTDADISKELSFRMATQPDYVRQLEGAGLDLEMIKRDIAIDLAKMNILTKGIVVTPQEVDTYIKNNPAQFSTPAEDHLLYIVLNDPNQRTQVDRQLASGVNFQQVAMAFSVAPNARQNQGQFPVTEVDKFPVKLQQIVSGIQEQHASAWIRDGNQYVKFYVDKKTPSQPMTITDHIRETVRRDLAMQRGAQAVDLNKRILDKLRSSNITVFPKYLADPWKTEFQSFQAQELNNSLNNGQTTPGSTATPSPKGTPAPGSASSGAPPKAGSKPAKH